jgi:hypothetical protein
MKLRTWAPVAMILVLGGLVAWFRARTPPTLPPPAPPPVSAARPDLSMIDGLCRLPAFVTATPSGSAGEIVRPPLLPKVRVVSAVVAGMPMKRTAPRALPPDQAFVAAAVAIPELPPAPEAAGLAEMEQVQAMLRDFRTRMGENPVGCNAEIMRDIMGGNPVKARLGPPPGQSLNDAGELIDPWGTPYFFHQLSAKSMEVRSAGPDRKLWSPDDLTSH